MRMQTQRGGRIVAPTRSQPRR